MEQFIQSNSIWIVPIVSIVLTIVIKIAAKNESETLGFVDYLDFGFDLSISAMTVILINAHSQVAVWLLLLFFLLIMIASVLVNRIGWNKHQHQINLKGIIIPDVVGVFLLVIATLYEGGIIK